MRSGSTLRGFTIGLLVGLLAGSAGMASATFGMNGWTRFSEDFRNGYMNGFLDMANLARNLQPGGWVDERYPPFPQAKPQEWRGVIDKLYQDPANKDYTITSMIQLAAKTMEGRYGKPVDPALRAKARMDAQLAAVREKMMKQQAEAAAKGQAAPAAPGAAAGTAAPPAATASGEAVELPVPARPKKWCRCDGTDPAAARAKRRAEAAAENDEPKEGAAKAPVAASPKGGTAAPADAPAKAPAAAAPAPHAGTAHTGTTTAPAHAGTTTAPAAHSGATNAPAPAPKAK